jgi:hypothetical protein
VRGVGYEGADRGMLSSRPVIGRLFSQPRQGRWLPDRRSCRR